MWEHIKELSANVYGASALAWVLTHLVLIEIHGTFRIYEPNTWLLWFEIAYTSGALILFVERFIKDILRMRREAKER